MNLETAVRYDKVMQSIDPSPFVREIASITWECSPLAQTILNQKYASLYHIELPFLG